MHLSVWLVLFTLGATLECSKVVLPALSATELSEKVAEPSGATFCATTGSLFVICDTSSKCPGIYELDMQGNLLHVWNYPNKRKDVEAVACDDENQLLYVAEEGDMRITSYQLPHFGDRTTYELKHSTPTLIELGSFGVDLEVCSLSKNFSQDIFSSNILGLAHGV